MAVLLFVPSLLSTILPWLGLIRVRAIEMRETHGKAVESLILDLD